MTFFVMHLLGRDGMPRRVADYQPTDDFERWNMISSIGTSSWCVSIVPFVVNVVRSLRTADDGRRRPVARQLAGVGDDVAAAGAQLHVAPADPLGAPGVRPALEPTQRRRRRAAA